MSKDRYQISKLLGKSRAGEVYAAEDAKLMRQVALRRFLDVENKVDFEKHKDKFLSEAQSMSNIQHPNLLSVFDAGVDDDGPYIISQLLDGKSLYEEIKKGPLSLEEVVELAKQMLDALSVAHDIGYYHGALTPNSIFMNPRARGGYRYVILDMGLSRLTPYTQGEEAVIDTLADPAIFAPELFDGGEANERADLYMLGQILYLCLVGTHPFEGIAVDEAKEKHLEGLPPITEYNKFIHKDLVIWLSKLTAVEPSDRPASAVEALDALCEIPISTFKTPAKLTETGVTPVFKGRSALSAIVESGPVKKMTTSLSDRSEMPSIPVIKGTVTKKSSYDVPVSEVATDSELQEIDMEPRSIEAGEQRMFLELVIGILILVLLAMVIVFVLLSGENPSDYNDETSGAAVTEAVHTEVN